MRIFVLLALAVALVACNGETPQEAPPAETAPLSDLDRAFLEQLAAHHQGTLALADAAGGELAEEIRAWAQDELDEIDQLADTEFDTDAEHPHDATREGLVQHLEEGIALTEPASARSDANPQVTALAQRSAEQHRAFADELREEEQTG